MISPCWQMMISPWIVTLIRSETFDRKNIYIHIQPRTSLDHLQRLFTVLWNECLVLAKQCIWLFVHCMNFSRNLQDTTSHKFHVILNYDSTILCYWQSYITYVCVYVHDSTYIVILWYKPRLRDIKTCILEL